ncbi:MAG: glycosyltransferase family 2 protein [Pseudomonadota bacterium]
MNAALPLRPQAASLSVVVPLYNEAGNVLPLVDRIHVALADHAAPWELILVDDGSRDATAAEVAQARERHGEHVRSLRFARNHGQTAAMQAGIDAARGELIATLDGDLQNDPADIPRMIEALQRRDLDLLCGRRADRQDAWLWRKLPSRIANRLIARVTGVRISDYGCSLKLYRARVIKRVRLHGEMHRLIPVWAAMVTAPARIGEIDVGHHPRTMGESKYGLSRTFRVVLDLLTAFFFLRFQTRPGHFFGGLGLLSGALGGGVMIWLMWCKFVLGQDIGTRPMFFTAILLLMFSIQFITTGILAEMLTRVLQQDRPQALVEHDGRPGTPLIGADEAWHLPAASRSGRG